MRVLFFYRLTVLPNMISFLILHQYQKETIQVHHISYTLCKFQTTNHKLSIETGRWNGIDRENRRGLKCNSRSIGDEFHYIMECHFFYWKILKELLRPNVRIAIKNVFNMFNPRKNPDFHQYKGYTKLYRINMRVLLNT
jgi:hypothetical protein